MKACIRSRCGIRHPCSHKVSTASLYRLQRKPQGSSFAAEGHFLGDGHRADLHRPAVKTLRDHKLYFCTEVQHEAHSVQHPTAAGSMWP